MAHHFCGRPPSVLRSVDSEVVDEPVEVAGYRGEHTVPPIEGGLVGDAAQLGRTLDGNVAAHEPDEGDPDGERLSAALEDGAREGVEPPAAAAAAPPRDASASVPTPTSSRLRLSSTASLGGRNSSAVRPATSALKGFALPIWTCPIRPNAHPEGLSPNKDPGGRSG